MTVCCFISFFSKQKRNPSFKILFLHVFKNIIVSFNLFQLFSICCFCFMSFSIKNETALKSSRPYHHKVYTAGVHVVALHYNGSSATIKIYVYLYLTHKLQEVKVPLQLLQQMCPLNIHQQLKQM